MTMESKPASVRLLFTWKQFMPDVRAYKPSSPVIETECSVGVDVPLTHEFILNAVDIIQNQLSADYTPDPILTPLGMRYVIDQFEQVMTVADADMQDDDSAWDDGEEETATKPVVEDDEWEDAPAETKTKDDVDWDESWEV